MICVMHSNDNVKNYLANYRVQKYLNIICDLLSENRPCSHLVVIRETAV